MSADENAKRNPDAIEALLHAATDGADLVSAALNHLRGVLSSGGAASGPPALARQKRVLREWAEAQGRLIAAEPFLRPFRRGGQEHDIWNWGDRVVKVTRDGIFGLAPGLELALVSSSEDGRRFQLWEASPLEYLERLQLQNLLVPGLNMLVGVVAESDGNVAIVTAQPRFEIASVTEAEIDAWFAGLDFQKVTASGYYRAADNLAVFDAHAKNLVRFEDTLIPFDVIPCRPDGGFLRFIEDTLGGGHSLRAERRSATPRAADLSAS